MYEDQSFLTHRIVDTGEYMELLRGILSEGRDVSLTVTGNSMAPFLIGNRDRVLLSPVRRPLKRGDIALFQRTDGKYILHRICRVYRNKETGKSQYYFIGDNQTEIEGPIEEDQIFSLIMSVERKGKQIQEGDFWWLFFQHLWLDFIPLRRVISRGYAKITRKSS